MKIVVIGGTGLIGSKLVTKLRDAGHEAVAGLARLRREHAHRRRPRRRPRRAPRWSSTCRTRRRSRTRPCSSSSRPRPATSSTRRRRRRRASRRAVGRRHRPARRQRLHAGQARPGEADRGSSIPYSIVHATQFFEFVGRIADDATDGDTVRLSAGAVPAHRRRRRRHRGGRGRRRARRSTASSRSPGPSRCRFDDFVRRRPRARQDPREVIADPGRPTSAPISASAPSSPATAPAWVRSAWRIG